MRWAGARKIGSRSTKMASTPRASETGRPADGSSSRGRCSHKTRPLRSRSTAPPPVATTRPCPAESPSITFDSRSRKCASPSRAKMSGIDRPAFRTISSSTSTKGRWRSSANRLATFVLPLPGMPRRTRFENCSVMSFRMSSAAASGNAWPRKRSAAAWACITSMESPFSVGRLRLRASSMSSVQAGL